MLSKKVLIQNITNLSDARYFAAWGVDYMSFNQQENSPYFANWEKIKEIKEWVEGPKILIESNSIEVSDEVDGHILELAYNSLPLVKEAFFRISLQDLQSGLNLGKYILTITPEQIEQLKQIDTSAMMGSDFYLDLTNLDFKLMEGLPDWGIVLQGGEEEKVGFKSFDELDTIYDQLMD